MTWEWIAKRRAWATGERRPTQREPFRNGKERKYSISHFRPLFWDFDRALGSIDHRDANPRRWNTGPFFDAPWWRQLFTDADFWQLWVDRWQALRRTNFSESNLFGLVDRLANEVREAQPRQARR